MRPDLEPAAIFIARQGTILLDGCLHRLQTVSVLECGERDVAISGREVPSLGRRTGAHHRRIGGLDRARLQQRLLDLEELAFRSCTARRAARAA